MKNKIIRKYTPCHCAAYPFPHRPGGGSCSADSDSICKHGYPEGDGCRYNCSGKYADHSETLSAAERNDTSVYPFRYGG